MNLFSLWLASHASHSLRDYIVFALCGALGAAGYAAAAMPSWKLPSRKDGILEPNIVAIFVAGIVLAIIVDYAAPFSIIAGALGVPGLNLVTKTVLRLAELRLTSLTDTMSPDRKDPPQ